MVFLFFGSVWPESGSGRLIGRSLSAADARGPGLPRVHVVLQGK